MIRRPPRILVSNDDGINAVGIKTLERIARTLSDEIQYRYQAGQNILTVRKRIGSQAAY